MTQSARVLLSLLCVILVGCRAARAPSSTALNASTTPVSSEPPPETYEQDWQRSQNPNARYLVAIGVLSAQDDSVTLQQLAHARLLAARTLQSFDDLEVAQAHFDRAELVAESKRRGLPGAIFECGVTLHQVDERGTHFGVDVTVIDLQTENIVATMSGRATAPGPASDDSEQLALQGALDSAMRGVPGLLAALNPS